MADLEQFRDRHKGEKILIVALGPSMPKLLRTPVLSFGCNDSWSRCESRYLLQFNTPNFLKMPRLEVVQQSKPEAVFCFDGHRTHWKPYFDDDVLVPVSFQDIGLRHSHHASPVYQTLIAMLWFGCTEIGIIGMDLTDGHILAGYRPLINQSFADILRKAPPKTKIWNLSEESHVKTLPYKPLDDFLGHPVCLPVRMSGNG